MFIGICFLMQLLYVCEVVILKSQDAFFSFIIQKVFVQCDQIWSPFTFGFFICKREIFFFLCKILTIIHSLFISLSQLMVQAFFVGVAKFNAHACSPTKSASWTFQLISKFAILNRLTGNCSFGFIWLHGLICPYSPSTIKAEVCQYVKISTVILHIVTHNV